MGHRWFFADGAIWHDSVVAKNCRWGSRFFDRCGQLLVLKG